MGVQNGTWTPTKRRGPIAAEFQGPGPAALSLPSLFGNPNIKQSSKTRAPSYTFGSRYKRKITSTTPAPNSYNTSRLSQRGKDDVKAPSFHIKPTDQKPFITPSPAAYNPEGAMDDTRLTAPKYSFGIKASPDKVPDVPAPNAYSISDKSDNPSYSISGRHKEIKSYVTPSPGAYDVSDPNNYKNKAPAFSLSSRYETPLGQGHVPGPGAYTPEKVDALLHQTPKISFGIRHSPYIAMLKGDNYVTTYTESVQEPFTSAASGSTSNNITTYNYVLSDNNKGGGDLEPQITTTNYTVQYPSSGESNITTTSYTVREPTKIVTETFSTSGIALQNNAQTTTVRRISNEMPKKISVNRNFEVIKTTNGGESNSNVTLAGEKIKSLEISEVKDTKGNKNSLIQNRKTNSGSKKTASSSTSQSETTGIMIKKSPEISTTTRKYMTSKGSSHGTSVSTTTTQRKTMTNSANTTTRVHSDGHRVRSDTFTYSKKPVMKSSKIVTKSVKA